MTRWNRWYVYVGVFAMTAIAGEALVTFVRASCAQAFRIPSAAMVPTLLEGDLVLADKAAYLFHEPKRLDVIVFDYPEDPSKMFVKRIIGMPGERIEIREKRVLVDGKAIDEPYVDREEPDSRRDLKPRDLMPEYTVPPRHYFVLGDHRDRSYDSRFWGPVSRETIRGRVEIVYFSRDTDAATVRWNRIGREVR